MKRFEHIVKGGASPQGKPRVYFTAHPKDFELYFDEVTKDIFKRQNCTIFYTKEEIADDAEREFDLSQMQLFVVPITDRLLREPCRARDVDIPFALKQHIPVLPIMCETGLAELFNRTIGDLQFLDKTADDETAISFDDKLTTYLDSVLVSDELAALVRGAFDAYIFLSYRKKDRKLAQELMRKIHANDLCRDIAIWYDEFLVPGEDFNVAISNALKKSKLFALAVTPNLIVEENYVLREEYPSARNHKKTILPVEMESTDRKKLKKLFRHIPKVINQDDKRTLEKTLLRELKGSVKDPAGKTALETYYIGLAYLKGIDVEVDFDRAVELLKNSSQRGCYEAMKKLSQIYRFGEGVGIDHDAAIFYQEALIKISKEKCDRDKSWNSANDYLFDLLDLAEMYMQQSLFQKAKEIYQDVENDCVTFINQYKNNAIFFVILARCSSHLAEIANKQNDNALGEQMAERELKTHRVLSTKLKAPETRREVAVSLGHMTIQCLIGQKFSEAEKYIREAIEISSELAESGVENSLMDLASHYGLYGEICKEKGNTQEALEYYQKALSIEEKMHEDNNSDTLETNLSIGYEKLADLYYKLGEIKTSCDYLRKDYDICNALHKKLCTAESLGNLLGCYQRLARNAFESECYEDVRQDVAEACVSLKGLLRTSDSLNNKMIAIDVFNKFGKYYFKFGKYEKAKESYTAAMYLCSVIRDEDSSGKVEAKLYTALNGIKMINDASEQ